MCFAKLSVDSFIRSSGHPTVSQALASGDSRFAFPQAVKSGKFQQAKNVPCRTSFIKRSDGFLALDPPALSSNNCHLSVLRPSVCRSRRILLWPACWPHQLLSYFCQACWPHSSPLTPPSLESSLSLASLSAPNHNPNDWPPALPALRAHQQWDLFLLISRIGDLCSEAVGH